MVCIFRAKFENQRIDFLKKIQIKKKLLFTLEERNLIKKI